LQRLKTIEYLKPGTVQVILPEWFPPTLDEIIIFLKRMSEEAKGISLILYNPPHAKKNLLPEEWNILKKQVPTLMGVKVFDKNSDLEWYESVRKSCNGLSVFIPGHNLASGIKLGDRERTPIWLASIPGQHKNGLTLFKQIWSRRWNLKKESKSL
jgi:dihydrodipicolinate synthase/N-acetylneuraminate lyase